MQPPSGSDDNPLAGQDDPAHWLNRLSAPAWLSAAENELDHLRAALARRAYRPAVTHARRAAGMALNAVLRLAPHERWGRSYMEHVVALASDEGTPAPVRAAATALRSLPAGPPVLVPLGKPDTASLDAAQTIVAWAGQEVSTRVGWPGRRPRPKTGADVARSPTLRAPLPIASGPNPPCFRDFTLSLRAPTRSDNARPETTVRQASLHSP